MKKFLLKNSETGFQKAELKQKADLSVDVNGLDILFSRARLES